MAGRPDKQGKRMQLEIGLYKCPKCGASFREVLRKKILYLKIKQLKRGLNLNCPNCGKEITIEGIKFCPYCAYAITAIAPKSTHSKKAYKPMRMSAGFMSIIGACIAIAAGILYLTASVGYFSMRISTWTMSTSEFRFIGLIFLILGIIAISAFAFGLIAGIFALKKRRLPFALFGMSWLTASGILMSVAYLWQFGLPIAILVIIGVIFIVVARSDFSKPNN